MTLPVDPGRGTGIAIHPWRRTRVPVVRLRRRGPGRRAEGSAGGQPHRLV